MIYLQVPAGIHVAVLPGCVFLTGIAGHQIFSTGTDCVPVEGDLPSFFAIRFPDKAKLEASAQMYAEGHTNKDKFKAGVEKLMNARKITEHDRNKLRAFIDSCDCVPSKVRKRMEVIGYAHLLDLIDFADKDPRLESTVDTFWGVLKPFGAS